MHLSHYFTHLPSEFWTRLTSKFMETRINYTGYPSIKSPPHNLNFLLQTKYIYRYVCMTYRDYVLVKQIVLKFSQKYWWGELKSLKNMIHWKSPSHPYPKRRPGKVNKSSHFDRLTLLTDLAYTPVNWAFVYFIILFYPAV